MKKTILPKAAGIFLATLSISSCIDDSSSYGGNALPALTITVPGDAEMPVYNFAYGEECVLTPDISYNGPGELSYEWSIGTYTDGVKGKLESVSNEKTLRYFFPKGGAYYAHLKVTDGTVGLVQDFELSINRTFEQGYLVLSNNSNGEGNLTFIKDLTREEIEAGVRQTILENCLQRVNPELGKAALTGALHIQWYAFDFTTMSPVLTNRLVVITEDEGLYLDPNTFVATSTLPYEDVIPGFKGKNYLRFGTSPIIYDPDLRRYVSFDSENMFGYEDSGWKSHVFDHMQTYVYSVGLNQNYITYFVNLSPLTIYNKNINSAKWTSTESLVDNSGYKLFRNDELLALFKGEAISTYSYPCYVFTKDKSDGKYYCTALNGFNSTATLSLGKRTDLGVNASTAVPQPMSTIVVSELYHRAYFYNGNKFYVMLPNDSSFNLPSVNETAISFPSNEEVTFVTINTDPDNNPKTQGEDMLIATVDKTTGRGSIYVYDVKDIRSDNPDPAPKATYRNCSDRIFNISYKPRIS